MANKNLLIALAAAVLLALLCGCTESTQDAADANTSAATTTASTAGADTGAAPGAEGCGGCSGAASGGCGGAAGGGCGGCAKGEGAGASEDAGVTLTLSGGAACDGNCTDCAGDDEGAAKSVEASAAGAAEGGCDGCAAGAKPAGGCSTCPGTAKTLTAMAGDEKVVLSVSGMTCGSCEKAIRDTLATVKGVKLGIADHQLARAWVAYDPKVTDVKAISAAISGLGYTVGGEVEHVAALPALKAGHQRGAVYIDGMACPDCTGQVSAAISGLGGVDAVALDRQFNILFVDYDPAKLQPAAVKAKLVEIGYSAALPGEALVAPAKPHCAGCPKAEATPADAA